MELNPNDESILELLKDSNTRRYFLSKYKDVKLFFILKDSGYFETEQEPLPFLINNGKYYSIPEWEILRYLENISSNTDIIDYKKYAQEILNIINNVTEYHIDEHIEIDNYLTWWYFIKILINIPNEIISLKMLSHLKVWINARFDNHLICSEIVDKLIPKFLNNTSQIEDIKKAELIIEIICTVKKEEKKPESEDLHDLFGDNEKYKLIFDGYYFEEFFNKNYKLVADKCSNDLIFKISDILKSTLKKEILTYSSTEDDFNIHFAISIDGNKYEIHSSAYYRGNSHLGLNKLFGKKLEPVKSASLEFVANNLEEFSNLLQKLLIEKGFIKGNNERMKLSRGRYIYYGPFSVDCWESLNDEENLSYYEANDMILYALKKILAYRANFNFESTKIILKKLFLEDYFILKKIALYIIGNSKINYSDIFCEIIDENDNSNILFEETFFGDELRNALPKLTLEQELQNKLLKIIEEGPKFYYCEINDEYYNLWKQKLFKALSHHELFENKFKLLFEITKKDYSLGPAIGAENGEFVDENLKVAPINIQSILKMKNDDIVEKLLKIKDIGVFDKTDNFYTSYNEALKTRPEKFTDDLKPFLKAYPNEIFYLLYNLDEAWKSKKSFNWSNLFEFILSLLDNINFDDINQPVDYIHGLASLRDIIGLIGDLIQDGTRSDENAFPKECNEKARLVLSKIFSNYKQLQIPFKEDNRYDSFLFALNTILGKNILALILLSLREARITFGDIKDDSIKWNIDQKNIYEDLLINFVYEAYLFLGNSIRNFIYLDKNWIYDKVSFISKLRETDIMLWEAFMNGYLFNRIIGKDLYELMKENYEFSVNFNFKDEDTRRGLIRHIGIIYLGGSDSIRSGLISGIIKRNNYNDLRELINYFWAQRKILLFKTSPENDILLRITDQKKLILEFLNEEFINYSNKETITEESKKILSQLGKLSVYIDEINDENIEWLILSAKYISSDYVSPFFIENLNKLKDKGYAKEKTSKYVGKIFLAILENSTPDYEMKNIKEIVEYLFSSENKEAINSANSICDIYAQRSNYSLKEIWEKYNN